MLVWKLTNATEQQGMQRDAMTLMHWNKVYTDHLNLIDLFPADSYRYVSIIISSTLRGVITFTEFAADKKNNWLRVADDLPPYVPDPYEAWLIKLSFEVNFNFLVQFGAHN